MNKNRTNVTNALHGYGLHEGFTLIELSIVLVIIGLIVGGILTGRSLIDTAASRAQISQITKYRTAINTFRGKYGHLPGDIPDPYATSFGFEPRGSCGGQGDGNGIIEGDDACNYGTVNAGTYVGVGEIAVSWSDLTVANLLDTSISSYNISGGGYPSTSHTHSTVTTTSSPSLYEWIPTARIGNGNFVYIFSYNSTNLFGLSAVVRLRSNMSSADNPGITVQQAYSIDSKTDDGLPMSGATTVCFPNNTAYSGEVSFAAGSTLAGANGGWDNSLQRCNPTTAATAYQTTNCYDNNNVAGAKQTYSLANADVQNCALSFRFQ